jgi:L-idonate 5-dehydrogenase
MQAIVCHAPKDLRVEAEEQAAALTSGQLRVRVARGGICGSDLHYYQHGGFGAVRLKEPMVLGHEISAVIEEVGDPQSGFSVGQRIPSRLPGRVAAARTATRACPITA